MGTVLTQLITPAFLDLTAVESGVSPSTGEQSDALLLLNQILDSWSAERLTVYTQKHEAFNLTSGTDAYTFGNGGSWNTSARPVKVYGASARYSQWQGPVEVISFEEFSKRVLNPTGRTDALPSILAVDNASPLLNVKVWPPPNLTGVVIDVHSWQPLAAFATTGDTVSFPPGYELALRRALAINLYPMFPREGVDPQALAALAQEAKATIVQLNQSINMMPQVAAPPPTAQ